MNTTGAGLFLPAWEATKAGLEIGSFRTPNGAVRIVPRDERFVVYFEDEALGSYSSTEQVLDDLIAGACYQPSAGNTADLGLPNDLEEWTFVPDVARPR